MLKEATGTLLSDFKLIIWVVLGRQFIRGGIVNIEGE